MSAHPLRRTLVVAGMLSTGLVMLAPSDASALTASLTVEPGTVAAGGSVTVSGRCEANSSGFVLSPAFLHDATHDFAGVGAVSFNSNASGAFSGTALVPASTAAGRYTVTARCGGGNLGVSATLTVTAAAGGGSVPTAVPAGTGGLAAPSGPSQASLWALGGAGSVLLVSGGVAIGRRRHRVSARVQS